MEFSIQQLSRLVMDLFLSRACTYNRTQIKAFKIVIQSLVEELSVMKSLCTTKPHNVKCRQYPLAAMPRYGIGNFSKSKTLKRIIHKLVMIGGSTKFSTSFTCFR
ncbi:hypothetical protein NC653_016944 [Populus alba x Populus x berolinensis]|uniref:Uncharacterized protein n=1 Tax=Populus alba x Populus x berolinensis TaxID=444605 RepID=A0AAD6VZW7_9ROSI|nr:hypothetical protein NC653_016944 [Populus alba x Populus x berolinensis]